MSRKYAVIGTRRAVSTWRAVCLAAYAVAGIAQAQTSEADFCGNGWFPREQEQLSLGTVQGRAGERIHFVDDHDGCPASGPKCMRGSYLVPGDEVLVGKRHAAWACVWYQGRHGESVSWVPARRVALHPAPPLQPVRGWVGRWSDGTNVIRIVELNAGKRLQILSNLRWDGGTSPDGEPLAHFGGTKAVLDVRGSKATASEDACRVNLTRIGKYLVADDNGKCGALNVRHTGVYFRRPR